MILGDLSLGGLELINVAIQPLSIDLIRTEHI